MTGRDTSEIVVGLDRSPSARAAWDWMLVIGTRERVGLDRLVHDSVSQSCLNNAQFPVVAVPPHGGQSR
jgi:hypothetical protein